VYACFVGGEGDIVIGVDFAGGGHIFNFIDASPQLLLHIIEVVLLAFVNTLQ